MRCSKAPTLDDLPSDVWGVILGHAQLDGPDLLELACTCKSLLAVVKRIPKCRFHVRCTFSFATLLERAWTGAGGLVDATGLVATVELSSYVARWTDRESSWLQAVIRGEYVTQRAERNAFYKSAQQRPTKVLVRNSGLTITRYPKHLYFDERCTQQGMPVTATAAVIHLQLALMMIEHVHINGAPLGNMRWFPNPTWESLTCSVGRRVRLVDINDGFDRNWSKINRAAWLINSIFHWVILAETYQYFYVVKIEQQDDDEE